jgi:hypothetical protein
MFKKGQSGNANGRPKGAKGVKTLEWEEFGRKLLSAGTKRASRILEESNDEEFMKYYLHLVEYWKPKQQRIESVNQNDTQISINVNWDGQNLINPTSKASLQSGESPEGIQEV